MSIYLDAIELIEASLAGYWEQAAEFALELTRTECAVIARDVHDTHAMASWMLKQGDQRDWTERMHDAPYLLFALQCRALGVLHLASVEYAIVDRVPTTVFYRPAGAP